MIDGDNYAAPGHMTPLPDRGVFASGGLCDHAFELQSMRNTIENLRAQLADALRRLELAEDKE